MNAITAETERCLRSYQWMREFMHWEQDHAFPTLQLVSNPSTLGLILHLMRLDSTERRRLTENFVRSAHPLAVERLKVPLRVDEARELGEVQECAQPYVEQVRAKLQRNGRAGGPFDRNRLIKALRAELDPFFDGPPQSISAQSWIYEAELGDWVVRTQFDLSSKLLDKAVYSHSIRRADVEPTTLAGIGTIDVFEMTRPGVVQRVSRPHVAAGSLMQGVGFGPCTFELHGQADENAMVEAVIAHFKKFWTYTQETIGDLDID